MAGQKSGKAPGNTSYAPGGAEVWSDNDHDYFTDRYFDREGSLDQIQRRRKDQDRLEKIKGGSYTVPQMCKGGKVIRTWGK